VRYGPVISAVNHSRLLIQDQPGTSPEDKLRYHKFQGSVIKQRVGAKDRRGEAAAFLPVITR
jgi:hypothetical protein